MNRNIIHSALFRIIIPIPYGALIYLLLLMVNNTLFTLDELFISVELFFCIGLTYLTFESNRLALITLFARSKLSALVNLVQILVNAGLTLLLVYLALLLYFLTFLGYSSISGFQTEVTFFSLFFGITSILFTALSISYTLLNKKNDQLIFDEETLKEQVQFELETYQAEMNPELLFESLESAIELLDNDVYDAEEHIDQLAMVYRYMLSNRNRETIAVEQEINAANNLISLHNVKYQGLIHLKIELDKWHAQVVPGAIPIILEEIIKSTLITKNRPLNIVLGTEDNYLTLSYKLNDKLNKSQHEEMTIKRLQTAYSFISDLPLVKIQAYGECFYKIPTIDKIAAQAI